MVLIDSLGDLEMDAIITAFADDSKVMLTINNEIDALKLQDSMEKIYDWEKANNMRFNVSKFKLLQFGKKHDLKTDYNYLGPGLDDMVIQSEDVRDLGVTISSDMSFDKHISKVISKVNQRVGFFQNF